MIRIRASFLIAILSAAPLGFAQRGAPVEQQLTFDAVPRQRHL